MYGGGELLAVLAGSIRQILENTSLEFGRLQELRLRAGQPFFCQYGGKEYGFLKNGEPVEIRAERGRAGKEDTGNRNQGFYIVDRRDVKETLEYLSSYSLYAYEEELRQGFFTIRGGHRVGLAGKAVLEDGKIRTVRSISFLNIRLAHQIRGCAEPVFPCLYEGERILNTLVVSPPGCGKTTLLRDMIRMVSEGAGGRRGVSTGVADERSELAACYQGIPQNDLGSRTDVFDNCPKAAGLMMLIRTMAPRVVAADEIGGKEDLDAVRYAGSCGCAVFASAHGASLEELRSKPCFLPLMEEGFFERYILLEKKWIRNEWQVGHVKGIYDQKGEQIWA